MEKMSRADFIKAVREHKGAEFMTIVAATVPTLRKTGNPFKNVTKVCEQNVCVGFNYEACTNRQRTREQLEADFVAAPRKWGTRIDLKTVEHKGNVYLSINPQRVLSVQYFADGKEIDKADLAPFLSEKSESRQGTEKEIVYRDVNVGNIKAVKFQGKIVELF